LKAKRSRIENFLAIHAPQSFLGRIKKDFLALVKKMNWPARLMVVLLMFCSAALFAA